MRKSQVAVPSEMAPFKSSDQNGPKMLFEALKSVELGVA